MQTLTTDNFILLWTEYDCIIFIFLNICLICMILGKQISVQGKSITRKPPHWFSFEDKLNMDAICRCNCIIFKFLGRCILLYFVNTEISETSLNMWDLRSSRQWRWRKCLRGMWCWLVWYKFADVSEERAEAVPRVDDGCSTFLWNVSKVLSDHMASHARGKCSSFLNTMFIRIYQKRW
jgi:hypothetical protein